MLRSLIRLLLGGLVLAAAAPAIAQVGSRPYNQNKGRLAVRDTGVVVLHDGARDKDLQVRIRAPEPTDDQPGPFPLVVFSHGMGGSSAAFASLSECLASHGYIVVHPTHSDSVSLGTRAERRERMRKLLTDPAGSVAGVDLPDRVADVKFILDSLDEVEAELDAPGIIDRERMGMAGHSAGAMTTQVLGGMEFFAGRLPLGSRLAEARFGAFAVISGQGTNRRGITEDSWKSVDRPWLVITGSEDVSRASSETPGSRREPYEYAPADGTKYLLYFEGATHSSYQGKGPGALLDGGVPENVRWIADTTDLAVLAFFDAYLRGSDEAKGWLDSGAIAEREGGELEFRHK